MYNKQTNDEMVARMQQLINFGKVNESKGTSSPIVEFKRKAANGKTYGIIRESTRYYIMEAPEKDTEVLAEDFNYIGGFNNRKEHEYSSYTKASNALNLKLMSINEGVEKDKRVILEAPKVNSEWETQITESMRNEINRFKQIASNVEYILAEDKSSVPSAHTLPEAPAKNPSDKKVNFPFTDTAVAKGDKDFNEEETDHVKAGTPYTNKTTANMESDKNPKGNSGNVYSEKPKYVDTGVAGKHKEGGKVVKVNEGKNEIKLRLTEAQVLAWSRNHDDYMDKSSGTHIGDSFPYTEEPDEDTLTEQEIMHKGTNQNSPKPGTNEIGDSFPYTEKTKVNEDFDFDDDDEFDDDDDKMFNEGKEPIYEVTFNDFGKHPSFKVQPMTLPPNKEVAINGAREWDDESVKGEQPFGQKIGDSSPYNEIVKSVTNSIMDTLMSKKKV